MPFTVLETGATLDAPKRKRPDFRNFIYQLEDHVAVTLIQTVPSFAFVPRGQNDYCENFIINVYGRLLAHDAAAVEPFVPKNDFLAICVAELERVLTSIFRDYEDIQPSWYSKMDALTCRLSKQASDKQQDQLQQIGKRIAEWSRRSKSRIA